MHIPTHATPLRGALLRLVARVTAFRWGRALLVRLLLKETRISELPEAW